MTGGTTSRSSASESRSSSSPAACAMPHACNSLMYRTFVASLIARILADCRTRAAPSVAAQALRGIAPEGPISASGASAIRGDLHRNASPSIPDELGSFDWRLPTVLLEDVRIGLQGLRR